MCCQVENTIPGRNTCILFFNLAPSCIFQCSSCGLALVLKCVKKFSFKQFGFSKRSLKGEVGVWI